MADNRVVIKINYDKDKNRKPDVQPKMVTVWHTKRIAGALVILILLIWLPIFWFSGDGVEDSDYRQKLEVSDKVQPLNNSAQEITPDNVSVNESENTGPGTDGEAKNANKSKDIKDGVKRPTAIIFSRKVIRASLNSGPKDSEPYQPVKLPIKLGKNRSMEVFYFTELRDVKDRNLYHAWSKNGRVVEKKQLSILDAHAKVLSSRTLSFKDKGEWQIQLVDSKGKVYSEFNFGVNSE